MHQWTLLGCLLFPIIAFAFLLFPNHPVRAATLCVNPGGTGGCYATIQAAIDAASSGDTINIAAGTYPPQLFNTNKDNLTIIGAGALSTVINGTSLNNTSAQTHVSNITFRGSGVGNTSTGNLTLADSNVVEGGGVGNTGTITLTDVAVIHNNLGFVKVCPQPALNNSGIATLTNVTIGDNACGGIDNYGSAVLILQNVTIARNGNGFGGISNGAMVVMSNTIVANNYGFNCYGYSGNWISQGHNLSSDNTCPLTATGDITNTDPLLAPVGYYGGQTLVYAIRTGSPAIDAGTNVNCPATDQRGFPRPYGLRCDIGAYEYQPPFWLFYYFPIITK